jgi:hypothetical protein
VLAWASRRREMWSGFNIRYRTNRELSNSAASRRRQD